jgi:exodeoxyribonuclease VII large subunit
MKQLGFDIEEKPAAPKPKAKRKKRIATDAERILTDKTEKKIWKVGEFLDYWNEVFKAETFTVEGEVNDAREHPTGLYFTLKDDEGGGIMDCYMNPYLYRRLGLALEAGMVVQATGAANIYKQKGRFSFRAETIVLSGEGSLRQAYELLKKKLEAEGLFARKRPLPEFIERIGIITSRTGAVIDDFRKNLKPMGLALFFKDVRVEGASAADQIIEAIALLNREVSDLDAIVLIRGGGSLEDLQAFNNEKVARAVFASAVPVIAGIGHDRDVPIVSLVADRETSTPSIAALVVNSSWDRAFTGLPALQRDLFAEFEGLLAGLKSLVALSAEKMTGRLSGLVTRYRAVAQTMREKFAAALDEAVKRTAVLEKSLAMANPERNLRLGYSLVFDAAGRIVRDAGTLKEGDVLRTKMHKGDVESRVEKVIEREDNTNKS